MTTTDRLLGQARDRIRGAWDTGPLWVDPTLAPGLTDRRRSAVETATENAARSGLPVFVAVTPEIWIGHHDQWDAFTADLAFEMFDRTGEDQALVLFTEAETSARGRSYLVDGNGPSVPPNSQVLQRSSSDDFLPIELAVDYHLRVLVAAATGEPAPPPDFDPVDVGESRGTTSRRPASTSATPTASSSASPPSPPSGSPRGCSPGRRGTGGSRS